MQILLLMTILLLLLLPCSLNRIAHIIVAILPEAEINKLKRLLIPYHFYNLNWRLIYGSSYVLSVKFFFPYFSGCFTQKTINVRT